MTSPIISLFGFLRDNAKEKISAQASGVREAYYRQDGAGAFNNTVIKSLAAFSLGVCSATLFIPGLNVLGIAQYMMVGVALSFVALVLAKIKDIHTYYCFVAKYDTQLTQIEKALSLRTEVKRFLGVAKKMLNEQTGNPKVSAFRDLIADLDANFQSLDLDSSDDLMTDSDQARTFLQKLSGLATYMVESDPTKRVDWNRCLSGNYPCKQIIKNLMSRYPEASKKLMDQDLYLEQNDTGPDLGNEQEASDMQLLKQLVSTRQDGIFRETINYLRSFITDSMPKSLDMVFMSKMLKSYSSKTALNDFAENILLTEKNQKAYNIATLDNLDVSLQEIKNHIYDRVVQLEKKGEHAMVQYLSEIAIQADEVKSDIHEGRDQKGMAEIQKWQHQVEYLQHASTQQQPPHGFDGPPKITFQEASVRSDEYDALQQSASIYFDPQIANARTKGCIQEAERHLCAAFKAPNKKVCLQKLQHIKISPFQPSIVTVSKSYKKYISQINKCLKDCEQTIHSDYICDQDLADLHSSFNGLENCMQGIVESARKFTGAFGLQQKKQIKKDIVYIQDRIKQVNQRQSFAASSLAAQSIGVPKVSTQIKKTAKRSLGQIAAVTHRHRRQP